MLETVISGGQTGADRAALDAALAAGFPCGGWCPDNRQAEDGPIPANYPLQESQGGYRQRTLANVKDSDATVIFYRSSITGGTRLTLDACIKRGRPYTLIDSARISVDSATQGIGRFIDEYSVTSLNVAGPRASGCPSIYDYVRAVVEKLLAGPPA